MSNEPSYWLNKCLQSNKQRRLPKKTHRRNENDWKRPYLRKQSKNVCKSWLKNKLLKISKSRNVCRSWPMHRLYKRELSKWLNKCLLNKWSLDSHKRELSKI